MKIKTYFEALLINEALKKLNLDISQMNPNDRVKIKDGVLLFEPEKECFVSKQEPIETPLEICKRLYFEGVQFEVYTTKRIQTIPNDFRIDYENGDVVLYLPGEKYTLYSKSFNSFVKIIEAPENSEQLEYYYLKLEDIIQKGDEYFDENTNSWVPMDSNVGAKLIWNSKYRRKIQKNPTS